VTVVTRLRLVVFLPRKDRSATIYACLTLCVGRLFPHEAIPETGCLFPATLGREAIFSDGSYCVDQQTCAAFFLQWDVATRLRWWLSPFDDVVVLVTRMGERRASFLLCALWDEWRPSGRLAVASRSL
jgi:hypothetical protein